MLFARRPPAAFIFHVTAGVVTVLLLSALVVRAFFSPIDLFARPQSFLVGHLQFLVGAVIFYGFSSALLRLVPLPTGRSVLYTSTSWLFFLWAFYPVVSSSGMMRRIAGTMEDYLAAQRFIENLHLGAMLVFAVIQSAYLLFVVRRIRSSEPRTNLGRQNETNVSDDREAC